MNVLTEAANAQRPSVFNRVLVGLDRSEESREAARQAAILVDGQLTLLASYDIAPGIAGGTGTHVPAYLDEDLQREAATESLRRARKMSRRPRQRASSCAAAPPTPSSPRWSGSSTRCSRSARTGSVGWPASSWGRRRPR